MEKFFIAPTFDDRVANKDFATMYSRPVECFVRYPVINLISYTAKERKQGCPKVGAVVELSPTPNGHCHLLHKHRSYHSGRLVEGRDFKFP